MRIAAVAFITSLALPMVAHAQSLNMFDQLSFDAGLGVSYGPGYMGADESNAGTLGDSNRNTITLLSRPATKNCRQLSATPDTLGE